MTNLQSPSKEFLWEKWRNLPHSRDVNLLISSSLPRTLQVGESESHSQIYAAQGHKHHSNWAVGVEKEEEIWSPPSIPFFSPYLLRKMSFLPFLYFLVAESFISPHSTPDLTALLSELASLRWDHLLHPWLTLISLIHINLNILFTMILMEFIIICLSQVKSFCVRMETLATKNLKRRKWLSGIKIFTMGIFKYISK